MSSCFGCVHAASGDRERVGILILSCEALIYMGSMDKVGDHSDECRCHGK
jgi:hypothetical protein